MTTKPGRFQRTYVLLGCLVCAAVVAADLVEGRNLILIPLLVLAPLVTSIRSTPRQTFAVATLSALVALTLGWIDELWGSRRLSVAVATIVLGGLLGVWLAVSRTSRDRQLAASLPVIRAADRLKASLATGRMGEWSWDSQTGEVTWDANVATLFGIDLADFDGSFANWLGLIDERDRALVQDSVAAAVENREAFRFDHRCTWPDGTAHWIESIGDVIVDKKTDQVIGGFGLAIDVDERHRQIEERTRLLALERRQRERAEFIASVNDVLTRSVDIDKIMQAVTTSVIPGLGDWCSILMTIDRPRSRPAITVAHRDPEKVRWAEQLQRDYPYDPDARWGAAGVIRSGKTEFVANIDPRVFAHVHGDILTTADLGSVITVPLVGALGTLGAMQVLRGLRAEPFTEVDLELIDEIAGRAAAALNTAILFQRQARSRAALDTLQEVSGLIAAVATTDEIVRAALVHGGRGLRATSGTLFLTDADDALVSKEVVGLADHPRRDAELAIAQRAVAEGRVVADSASTDTGERFVTAAPMQIMNRAVGALAFTFDDNREPTPEELSMLATLGSRCAAALERATLYERDRKVALTLQHRLLSTLPPTPYWIEAAASYVPATGLEIGGDWFQIIEAADGRVVAIVGDAVGHGVGSAAAMGQLRASFATAVANDPDPVRALAAVDLFAELGTDTVAASAAYILFDPAGAAQYATAGHPPVVVVPARGAPRIVEGARGSVLGCSMTPEECVVIAFDPGDSIVMFTDGLVESRTESIDNGLQRLATAAEESRHLAPQEMCEAMVAALTNDRVVDDDIAILILRRTELIAAE